MIIIGRTLLYRYDLQPVRASDDTRTIVTIPIGASTAQIAHILENEEVIRSAWALTRYAEKTDADASLQAGSFVLLPSMSVAEIIEALTSGVAQESVVTVPEGLTLQEIDVLLTEKELIAPGEFIACALTCDFSSFVFLPDDIGQAERGGRIEGYAYPDTYFIVATDFSAQSFLERLLSTFEMRVVNALQEDIQASGHSLHEIVTMASLIEKETRSDEERAIVAGILWKRFDEGIGLGVDAAVRYITEKQREALTREDLDIDSSYNLRRYRGLTPGPIANPGMRSILAALHPEQSPYYYYLHGSDGIIRYAVTNDEHNENKARYLR